MKFDIRVFLKLCQENSSSDKSGRENQNTHFYVQQLLFKNRAINEIMWKNTVEPGRPQTTI
jgi:hypothetical protein